MSDSFLELRNLKKSFTSEEYVLQGINLQIDQGEFSHLAGCFRLRQDDHSSHHRRT